MRLKHDFVYPFLAKLLLVFIGLFAISACSHTSLSSTAVWQTVLAHDKEGNVLEGSRADLISVIRQGCPIRVGWGARRAADSSRTIEHFAIPSWISIRDSQTVEVQISDFLINLNVLGEPPEEHPRRARFGGTEEAIMWRANLKTDGSFNAVWYRAGDGSFVTRIPQQHPMRWVSPCKPVTAATLFLD